MSFRLLFLSMKMCANCHLKQIWVLIDAIAVLIGFHIRDTCAKSAILPVYWNDDVKPWLKPADD